MMRRRSRTMASDMVIDEVVISFRNRQGFEGHGPPYARQIGAKMSRRWRAHGGAGAAMPILNRRHGLEAEGRSDEVLLQGHRAQRHAGRPI